MNYKSILNKILNGLILFLFPLVLIIFVIEKAIELMRVIIQPIKHIFPEQKIFGIGLITLTIFIFLIFLCYLVGSIANHKKVQPIVNTLDEVLSTLIPTYHIIKKRTDKNMTFNEQDWKSILVAENNDWVIAFEIEQQSEKYSIVYFPNLPDSKKGKLKIIENSKIKYLNISVSELQNSIKKYGKGLELF